MNISISMIKALHFHAEYKDYNIVVNISDYKVVKGYMLRRETNLILGWCVLHQDELMQNWALMSEGWDLNEIEGLKKYKSIYVKKIELRNLNIQISKFYLFYKFYTK